MSHFYGVLRGNRGEATRGGSKNSGYVAVAASWDGAIEVSLTYDEATGKNRFEVRQRPWQGNGISKPLASGVIGE